MPRSLPPLLEDNTCTYICTYKSFCICLHGICANHLLRRLWHWLCLFPILGSSYHHQVVWDAKQLGAVQAFTAVEHWELCTNMYETYVGSTKYWSNINDHHWNPRICCTNSIITVDLTDWWMISWTRAAFSSDKQSNLASNSWKLRQCSMSKTSRSGATSSSLCSMRTHVVSKGNGCSSSAGTQMGSSMHGHSDCRERNSCHKL